jgi:hypothetical protein
MIECSSIARKRKNRADADLPVGETTTIHGLRFPRLCEKIPRMSEPETPFELPIDGILDLHTFRPKEIRELVPDYIAECRARGISEIRIIHGKGIGNLRRTVHAILARLPEVETFAMARPEFGGWGATIVKLRREGRVSR